MITIYFKLSIKPLRNRIVSGDETNFPFSDARRLALFAVRVGGAPFFDHRLFIKSVPFASLCSACPVVLLAVVQGRAELPSPPSGIGS